MWPCTSNLHWVHIIANAKADDTISSLSEVAPGCKKKCKQAPLYMWYIHIEYGTTVNKVQKTVYTKGLPRSKWIKCIPMIWLENYYYDMQSYVHQDWIGESKLDCGPKPAGLLEPTFKILVVEAFELYQRLNQINQEQNMNTYSLHFIAVRQIHFTLVPLKIVSTWIV